MSDLRSTIYDDIDEYINLCKYYNEKPVCDECGPNPYGKHAHTLLLRYSKEKSCVRSKRLT